MKKVTKLWVTKSGQKIRICDMTDEHLANAIKWLERVGEKQFQHSLNAAYSMPFSEDSMASSMIDNNIRYSEEYGFDPSDIPLYDDLVQEQERRKG